MVAETPQIIIKKLNKKIKKIKNMTGKMALLKYVL